MLNSRNSRMNDNFLVFNYCLRGIIWLFVGLILREKKQYAFIYRALSTSIYAGILCCFHLFAFEF